MTGLKELDGVSLTQDLPEFGIKKGMLGTIVHIYTRPELAYEVEFCDANGRTVEQLALTPDQIALDWSYPGPAAR